MTAMQSGTPACPDTADRRRRLSLLLQDMIPGAATIRVSLRDPRTAWPHPTALARDEAGKPVELSRTTAQVAARWILRAWPNADWDQPHNFDLATATLSSVPGAAVVPGR